MYLCYKYRIHDIDINVNGRFIKNFHFSLLRNSVLYLC
nr:MAG TPA: hypothetical protein [Caudoviricetes sp.]